MKKISLVFGMLFSSLIMISCNSEISEQKASENKHIGNPTPEDILSENKDADIFLLDGIVYKNAEEIEWVKERDLSLGERLGEIKNNTNRGSEFENYSATKLPIGTAIYDRSDGKGIIKIVVVNDKEIRYLGLIEG